MSSSRPNRPTPSMAQRIRGSTTSTSNPHTDSNLGTPHDDDTITTYTNQQPVLNSDPEAPSNPPLPPPPPPPSLSTRLPDHHHRPSRNPNTLDDDDEEEEVKSNSPLQQAQTFIKENKVVLPYFTILATVLFLLIAFSDEGSDGPPPFLPEDDITDTGFVTGDIGRDKALGGSGYYNDEFGPDLLDVSAAFVHVPTRSPSVGGGGGEGTLSPTGTAVVHIVPGIETGGSGGSGGSGGWEGGNYEDGADPSLINGGNDGDGDYDGQGNGQGAAGGGDEDGNGSDMPPPDSQTSPINLKWSDLGYETGMPTPDPATLPNLSSLIPPDGLPPADSDGSPINLKWSDLGYESGAPTPNPANLPQVPTDILDLIPTPTLSPADSDGSFVNLKWSDLGYASGSPTPDPANIPRPPSDIFLPPDGVPTPSPVVTSEDVPSSGNVDSGVATPDRPIEGVESGQVVEEEVPEDDGSAINIGWGNTQDLDEEPEDEDDNVDPLLTAPGQEDDNTDDNAEEERPLVPIESGNVPPGFEEVPIDEDTGSEINLNWGNQGSTTTAPPPSDTPTRPFSDNESEGSEINIQFKGPTKAPSAAPVYIELGPTEDSPRPQVEAPPIRPAPPNVTVEEIPPPQLVNPGGDDLVQEETPPVDEPSPTDITLNIPVPPPPAPQGGGGGGGSPPVPAPPAPAPVGNPQVITVPVDYPATPAQPVSGGGGGGSGGGQQPPPPQEPQLPQLVSPQQPQQPYQPQQPQMVYQQPPPQQVQQPPPSTMDYFSGWTLPIMMLQVPQQQMQQLPYPQYQPPEPQQQQQQPPPQQQQQTEYQEPPETDIVMVQEPEESEEEIPKVPVENPLPEEVPPVELVERETRVTQPKPHNWEFNGECWSQLCVINEEKPKYGISNEDDAIYEIFYTNPPKCCGVVVEIGAGDGLTNSASHFFEYGMGWKSVLIEANPTKFEELEKNRPDAINVNGAFCEGENDHVTYGYSDDSFHAMDGIGEVISEKHAVTPLLKSEEDNSEEIDCIQLQQVFGNLKITHVDVMIIRVEGDPLAVVRKMDWTVRVDIWIVLLDNDPDSTGVRDQLVRTVLEGNEYVQAEWDIKRWCEVEGNCLENEVFLRKGFNPLPKVETQRRLTEIIEVREEQRRRLSMKSLRG